MVRRTHLKFFLALVVFMAFSLTSMTAEALTIFNRTTSTITGLYISATGTPDWEENILAGQTISPGGQFNIEIRGTYDKFDLRIESPDGEEEYSAFPGTTKVIELLGEGKTSHR